MTPITLNLKANRRNHSQARWDRKTETYDTSECETKEVDVTLEIDLARGTVEIVKGGVTGHECFYISDLLKRQPENGMHWCAGTPGRWDSLYMPQYEVEILLSALRVAVT
jgi:hypothetical protein